MLEQAGDLEKAVDQATQVLALMVRIRQRGCATGGANRVLIGFPYALKGLVATQALETRYLVKLWEPPVISAR
jgi:hypothetical protein